MSAAADPRVIVAVPCHRDEPAVARTVNQLLAQIEELPRSRVVVCVNGVDPAGSPAAQQLQPLAEGDAALEVALVEQASKPAAWNRLRREQADITVFCDADVDVTPGSVAALVGALVRAPASTVVAAGGQRPRPGGGFVARVARVPFRLAWGGVAGTLYAARTDWLPEMPEGLLLDDAWLWAQASAHGPAAVVRVPEAVAEFTPAHTWADLWRQRLRAESGKRQLREWNLALAPEPDGGRPGLATLRAYPPADWPAVVALAAMKLGAALWSKRRAPEWGAARSTKGPRER